MYNSGQAQVCMPKMACGLFVLVGAPQCTARGDQEGVLYAGTSVPSRQEPWRRRGAPALPASGGGVPSVCLCVCVCGAVCACFWRMQVLQEPCAVCSPLRCCQHRQAFYVLLDIWWDGSLCTHSPVRLLGTLGWLPFK